MGSYPMKRIVIKRGERLTDEDGLIYGVFKEDIPSGEPLKTSSIDWVGIPPEPYSPMSNGKWCRGHPVTGLLQLCIDGEWRSNPQETNS